MIETRQRNLGLIGATLLVGLAAAGCNPPIAASSAAGSKSPTDVNEDRVAEDVARADAATSESSGATVAPPASSEPATAPKANRPPRADRLPSKPGEAEKITFDDLNLQMLANIVFRPFMVTERVKELEGKRVSISGYMHGGAAGSSGIKKFVLLKNTECKFGKDGQADHLAMVYLKSGTTADYTRSDVKVEGTLRIEPFTGDDGNTWSIYNLEDAQIR